MAAFTSAVDEAAGEGGGEGELGVSLRGETIQMVTPPAPRAGLTDNLVERGLLMEAVAGEGVVEAEGSVAEIAGEVIVRISGYGAQNTKKRER